MTVETNDTVDRWAISGTGPYVYSFRIFDESELTVYVDTGDIDPVPLTLNAHYTVSGVNDEGGGTITLTSAAATEYDGDTIDIRSNTAEYQPTSIRNQGRFLPEVHEDAFDRLARQIQDLSRRVARKFGYPDNTSSSGAMSSRSAWAERYLYVNEDGEFEPAAAISLTTLTQSIIGALLNPITDAEQAAGLGNSDLNRWYPEGHGLRYKLVGDDATDNTTALANLRAVAAQGVKCFIPKGTYRYATSPNWAINNMHLAGGRGAILKHTGTGVIFNMDAGADSSNGYATGLRVSDLILTGNANSTDGLFSRGVSYSSFKNIEVRSCSAKAYHLKWAVSNTYDTCIINRVVGGALSPVPAHGWYLTNAGSGFYTADCTFTGCVAENYDGGVSGVGADFHDAAGCTWIGGTFESLSQGLVIRADSRHNTFIGVWFEDNDTNDIVDLGIGSTFINCNAPSVTLGPTVDVNGIGTTFVGGYLRLVELASGSRATSFHGCAFDSNASLGITGTGTYTAHGCYKLDTSVPGAITYSAAIPDVSGPRGSYTATLTGISGTDPTGTIEYWVDSEGVHLEVPGIEGISDTTAATITGMPAAIRPAATQRIIGFVKDNGVLKASIIQIETTGTITLFNGVGSAFTNSGTKGIDAGTLPPYRLT